MTYVMAPAPRIFRARRLQSALRCVAEALFSDEAGPPPADRLVWLGDDVLDFMARAGPRPRRLVRLALFVVMWVAPLLYLRLPLPWQSVPRRTQTLMRIERGLLGLPYLLVKTLLCIVYYEHPDVQHEVGFDGLCLVEHR